jgi:YHS domain-containing protein
MTMNIWLGTFALLAGVAAAAEKVDAVNKDKKGLALRGYDTVAYFVSGAPAKGSPEFTHEWNGAKWLFASAENRDKFAASPEKYAPQYGGYCAWAVSKGHTANANPENWKIVDGKLYVNYNGLVQRRWQKEPEARIAEADKNWPSLHK